MAWTPVDEGPLLPNNVPKDEQIANLRKELAWQREWRLRMTQECNALRHQLRELRASVDDAITTLGGYIQ